MCLFLRAGKLGGVMSTGLAFQDESYAMNNHCWVCGNDNPHGLYIKSYWDGDESVCIWDPKDHHCAGWPIVVNGGIITGIMDCHCICTAIAEYYKDKSQEEKESPKYWFATASLKVDFLNPTPINKPVQLRARIKEMYAKKVVVKCSLYSDGNECARCELLGVRVPANIG